MSAEYKLDAARHEAIYKDEIAPYCLLKSRPQENPAAVITGGNLALVNRGVLT
ncbi:hypothetical protein ACDW_44840 (plasmid) [Acidovorax sp. DW039]|uniref:hypothetical protein n=1 Tax=Acidovorax sp. DW039 TaxID=3095606 RepID=UPI00308F0559|nr:hypothetical protein ACDW_44840 [Acidovorax sp. DW039]